MQQKIRAILFSFLICICPLTFSGCSNAPAAPADSLISSSSEAETATTQPDTNSHDAVNLASRRHPRGNTSANGSHRVSHWRSDVEKAAMRHGLCCKTPL